MAGDDESARDSNAPLSGLAARMADFQPARLGRMQVPDIGWPGPEDLRDAGAQDDGA